MSDKTELNPDLKQLETSLGRLAIPGVSLDRDELMYQSGWAAAMASLGHKTAPAPSVSTPRSNQQWIWQASTLVATAAAILFGTMLLNPFLKQGGVEVTVAENFVPSGMEIAEPNSMEQANELNVVGVLPDLLQRVMDPGIKTFHAGLIVGPHFPAASEPGPKLPVSPSPGKWTPPMTQQDLLNELLPNRIDRSPKWSLFRMGGKS